MAAAIVYATSRTIEGNGFLQYEKVLKLAVRLYIMYNILAAYLETLIKFTISTCVMVNM